MDNKPTTLPLATVVELTMEDKVDLMWAAFTKGTPPPVAAPATKVFQEGDRVVWKTIDDYWRFGYVKSTTPITAQVVRVYAYEKAKEHHYGGQYKVLVPDFAHQMPQPQQVDLLKLELYNPQGEYKVGQ